MKIEYLKLEWIVSQEYGGSWLVGWVFQNKASGEKTMREIGNFYNAAAARLEDLQTVSVPKELLLRIKKHFQEGDPSKSGRFSHLSPHEIADIFVAECSQAHASGEQIYKDICEILKN